MSYFTPEFSKFLRGLAKNNDRDWFNARKETYESVVKSPFEEFVTEVIERVHKIEPQINPDVKSTIFRIYRDTRFSKDKRPYKPYASAVITPQGRKDIQYPGLYLQLSGEGIWIMGGTYKPDKENLYKIREAMADDPAEVKRILNAKAFKELFGELLGEENKVLPKEFKEAAVDFPLIFKKQFYYRAEYGSKALLRNDLPKFVVKHYRAGKKFNDFIKKAVFG